MRLEKFIYKEDYSFQWYDTIVKKCKPAQHLVLIVKRPVNAVVYNHSHTSIEVAHPEQQTLDRLPSSSCLLLLQCLARFSQPLLSPKLFNPRPPLHGLVTILLCALCSFSAKTPVDVALYVVALTHGFPEKPASVAFIEGIHDFFAVCITHVRSAYGSYEGDMVGYVLIFSGVWRWECILPGLLWYV